MSRLSLGLIFIVPFCVFAVLAAVFYNNSGAISSGAIQRFRYIKSAHSQATPGVSGGLVDLGLVHHPKIGKCTVAHGKKHKGYQQAIRTHLDHAQHHGYPMHVLDHVILDGLWTKEAALLDVMLANLVKPKGERLEWILWFDADTVVMNKMVPLEVFLPPDDRDDVHLLYTKDWNGLNNGVFLLRVSTWSLEMLSSILAYRTFKPKEKLTFTEQTAMEKVVQLEQYKNGAVECPPQWFNAYPNDGGGPDVDFKHERGQFLVHFAGVGDKTKAIGEWVKKLEGNRSMWEMPLSHTNYEDQIAQFWDALRREDKKKGEQDKDKGTV